MRLDFQNSADFETISAQFQARAPARKLVVDLLLIGSVRLDLGLELLDELDDFLDGAAGLGSHLEPGYLPAGSFSLELALRVSR